MLFRKKRNRRRIDVAKKTGEMKAVAVEHAPLFKSVFGTIAVTIAVTAGGFYGWQWATHSPTFGLTTVTVRGADRATSAQLLKLGGLKKGENLLTMDASGAEKAIAAHPWVERATIHRRLPRSVELVVKEHQPKAVAALGELYLVDDAGEPFKRLVPGDAMDLPLLTGLDRDAFVDHREATLARLRDGLAVLRAWQASAVGELEKVSEVRLRDDGITVVTESGLEVRLADGPAAPALERLAAVQKELERRSIEAALVRLDDRARPGRVTVQVLGQGSERRAGP